MSLQEEFAARVHAAITISAELGYLPTNLINMLKDRSADAVATRLVTSGDTQYGFKKICALGRKDISIEAIMSEPQFAPLFSKATLAAAAFRLTLV